MQYIPRETPANTGATSQFSPHHFRGLKLILINNHTCDFKFPHTSGHELSKIFAPNTDLGIQPQALYSLLLPLCLVYVMIGIHNKIW